MASLVGISDIITGDIFRKSVEITIENVPLPVDAVVKAALVETNKKNLITPVVVCNYNAGVNGWVIEFSKQDTAQLLEVPSDLTSSLKAKNCYLEVQISNPYNVTINWLLSVDKGLID